MIDLQNLKTKTSEEIYHLGMDALYAGDLETATYLCDYLTTRKRTRYRSKLIREMEEIGHEPIAFLSLAREIALKFQRTTTGKNHVYVILLDGYAKYRYGMYVGQTSREVETRFAQHREGGRLSAKCHRKMKMLLPSLFEHLNPLSTKEAKRIEEELADAFRAVGIRTEGGKKVKKGND
jgi:predicted GIY-YIG superfamily endonuclease